MVAYKADQIYCKNMTARRCFLFNEGALERSLLLLRLFITYGLNLSGTG